MNWGFPRVKGNKKFFCIIFHLLYLAKNFCKSANLTGPLVSLQHSCSSWEHLQAPDGTNWAKETEQGGAAASAVLAEVSHPQLVAAVSSTGHFDASLSHLLLFYFKKSHSQWSAKVRDHLWGTFPKPPPVLYGLWALEPIQIMVSCFQILGGMGMEGLCPALQGLVHSGASGLGHMCCRKVFNYSCNEVCVAQG